jgi:hypothetical protein
MHLDWRQSPQAPPAALPVGRLIAASHGTVGAAGSSGASSAPPSPDGGPTVDASPEGADGGELDELHPMPTAVAAKPTAARTKSLFKEKSIDSQGNLHPLLTVQ